MKCKKCGGESKRSSAFCTSCGEPQPQPLPPPEPPHPVVKFKKFWTGIPTLAKVFLIGGLAIIITISVVAGILSLKKSSEDTESMADVAGMYTFETATMMLNADGTFTVAEYTIGELSSGTWDTDGSSVTTTSPAAGVTSASYEIEGEGLRASDGDLWEKQ